MDINKMRDRFNNKINAIINNKREDNKSFLNSEEYAARIEKVKQSKLVLQTPGAKKNTKDYRNVSRYDVLSVNGIERLIKPITETTKKVIYFATNEELFNILHTAHLAIGHGGRNRMVARLKTQYANITAQTVMAYLELCIECQRKFVHPRHGTVSRLADCSSDAQPRRWTMNQLEALIDQYRKYPVLYDTNHEEYGNVDLESAYLNNIVEALQSVRPGVTEVDVISQWHNLMMKYAQATELQQSPNNELAPVKEPQMWYLQKLDFLREHVTSADIKLEDCSSIELEESSLFEPEITTLSERWGVGDPLASKLAAKEDEGPPPTKKRKHEENKLENVLPEDEIDIFGKFVAAQLRKIVDEEVRQDAILDIHKVLHMALKKQM